MRFVTTSFDKLDDKALRELLPLTNSPDRGDCRDDGRGAGSSFYEYLRGRLGGYVSNDHRWAIVAYENGEAIGWCMFGEIERDPSSNELLNVPTALLGFYVAPSRRRTGLASDLLDEARKLARKIGRLRLMVQPWNRGSSAFFRSKGFVEHSPFIAGWLIGISVLDVSVDTKQGTHRATAVVLSR